MISHIVFWVHILGIHLERAIERIVHNAMSKLGIIKEMRLDVKGNNSLKLGKALVELDLSSSLKSLTFINAGRKKIWVDFKCERLSHFCYFCGKIGHYAIYCKRVSYEDSGLEHNIKGKFNQWLKAEG